MSLYFYNRGYCRLLTMELGFQILYGSRGRGYSHTYRNEGMSVNFDRYLYAIRVNLGIKF